MILGNIKVKLKSEVARHHLQWCDEEEEKIAEQSSAGALEMRLKANRHINVKWKLIKAANKNWKESNGDHRPKGSANCKGFISYQTTAGESSKAQGTHLQGQKRRERRKRRSKREMESWKDIWTRGIYVMMKRREWRFKIIKLFSCEWMVLGAGLAGGAWYTYGSPFCSCLRYIAGVYIGHDWHRTQVAVGL